MSTDHQLPSLSTPAEPILMRWGSYAIGGALAGIVVGVWGTFLFQAIEFSDSRVDLRTFIDSRVAMVKFLSYLDIFQAIFGGVPGSVVGGLISALFSRRMRHPIFLASLWASILGLIALALLVVLFGVGMLANQRPAEILIMLANLPATGAVYGLLLGLSAPLIERGFRKMRRPRTIQAGSVVQ